MSQHLITEFISRTYAFKAFHDGKIVNRKVKKFQASNRKNNVSPKMIAESTHSFHKTTQKKQIQETDEKDHIDIIV